MRVLIFCGGDPVPPPRWEHLPVPDLVIAADSGAETAVAAGTEVDVLVGDMDSISEDARQRVRDSGAVLETFPADKDATDLALALASAKHRGATAITVVGGGGGRMDHLLGAAAVVCDPALADVEISWITARETAYPVHSPLTLRVAEGTTVSVLAVGGDAEGVSLRGLRWPLRAARLPAWSSLGISNEARGGPVTIEAAGGVLLAVVNRRPRPTSR